MYKRTVTRVSEACDVVTIMTAGVGRWPLALGGEPWVSTAFGESPPGLAKTGLGQGTRLLLTAEDARVIANVP